MPTNLENSAVATGLEKVSFHSNLKERQCQGCSNYCKTALNLHTNKVMLKILQTRLQQYINLNLQIFKLDLGRGNRNQIANLHWIIKNLREFQKNSYFCFIDYVKVFDCEDHKKLLKTLRVENTRLPDLHLEKSACRSGSNS